MNIQEVRNNARKKLHGFCRVCPVCNGKTCAGEVPGMGGRGSGTTFQENIKALSSYKLNMRTLHGLEKLETACTLFGTPLAAPIMAAPLAGAEQNLGGAMTEDEMLEALFSGSRAAGLLPWGGDGVSPAFFETVLKFLSSSGGMGIPTIKPRATHLIIQMAQEAVKAGAPAVAIDIDAAAFPARDEKGLLFSPKKPEDIQAVINAVPVPLILKGIMTADEAALAADIGVSGIVVSNHGGRVMDEMPGTADALPAIAGAVKGRLTILFDGGIRSGVDVLKALALGADAVLVGRPLLIAAAGAGAEGVALALHAMRSELEAAMLLTGTPSIFQVPPSILTRVARPGT